jgi:hypothetical protein
MQLLPRGAFMFFGVLIFVKGCCEEPLGELYFSFRYYKRSMLSAIHNMLVLAKPPTQERFNTCILDLLNLRMSGCVTVPGNRDCYDALGYLKKKMNRVLIATLKEDGSVFMVGRNTVSFLDDEVAVSY